MTATWPEMHCVWCAGTPKDGGLAECAFGMVCVNKWRCTKRCAERSAALLADLYTKAARS